ncbi:MAG: Crp/Fnr family transcriptional regulator [Spirochaetales bacterium]|nr:Crp/Fnr family transcriptional regulator [Spirochaetales bacterium]
MDHNPLLQKYGKVLSSDQIVFHENEEGDQMFIIQEGKVQISRQIAGKETPIAVLEKGEFFGEMAIVNRIKRTASATTLAPTTLLAFDRIGLEQMVEKNPKIALSIIDKLCRRLQNANGQIQRLAQNSSHQAVWGAIQVLAHQSSKLGEEQKLADELSLSLALARTEVQQALDDLVASQVLKRTSGLIEVANFEKLMTLGTC